MSFIIYFDEDAQRKELIRFVRNTGVVATCVNEQHTLGWSDEEQIVFAASRGMAVFTYNERHFLNLHSQWIACGKRHHGIIVADQMGLSAREKAAKLALLVKSRNAEQMLNNLEYLSSW